MPLPITDSVTDHRMGLSSFFRKKPQQTGQADEIEGEYSSRAEEASQIVRGKRKTGKPSTEPLDPVLPEKKRARRRLLGAVALVIAAVIGLPMVFDAEPKALPPDIAIQIPSKDLPVTRSEAPHMPAGVAAGATLDQHEEVVDTPPSLPVPATASLPSRPASVPSPVPTPSTALKDGIKTDQKHAIPRGVTPKSAAVVANPTMDGDSTARANDNDGARARAILEGASAPVVKQSVNPSAKSTHIVLQVAALTSRDKAAELQSKLKAAGLASHTTTVATESGERIRVRIGPFASKEEADRARARLNEIGLSGSVVPG